MNAIDLVMLSLPIGSLLIGIIRGELNNTRGFYSGFSPLPCLPFSSMPNL